MSGVVGSSPQPESAHTAADYVSLLRRVRDRSGLSFRTIQRRASANGHSLPPSTLATMLGRDTLPNERLIAGFLAACGESREAVARWIEARRRIAEAHHLPPADEVNPAYRQLPMDIEEFVGREAQLRELVATGDDGPGATAVAVTAITGMAGVGKTRLAIRAGHLLAQRGMFDEVQLWTDLRGFDPHQPPVNPSTVLETFLHALGLPSERIPDDVHARAAFYRDRLAGKRALVLLDNAADEQQVLPLLPGGPTSRVLITSRRTLTTLAGSRHLELGLFTPTEVTALLARIAGRHRIGKDSAVAHQFAELCGHLPLAVTLAARRLATRPAWSLPTLVARLTHGDNDGKVGAIFDLSYRALPQRRQQLFGLLGAHLAEDIDAHAAAALAGLSVPEAEEALEALLDEHLLVQATPGRYRMHDLVRQFAKQHTAVDNTAVDTDAALARLLDHYLAGARQVVRQVHPTESRRMPAGKATGTWAGDQITTRAAAIRWVETEHRNLLALTQRAAQAPRPALRQLIRLITVLYRPLTNLGLKSTHIQLNLFVADTAGRIGDRRAQAQALEDLGTLYGQSGRLSEAISHNDTALAIWRELGDQTGQAGCLTGVGIARYQQGRFQQAIDSLSAALTASQAAGYRVGEASVLNYLGLVHQATGEFEQAIGKHEQSREVYRQAGSRHGEAIALANLAWAYQRSGRPGESVARHHEAMVVFARFGDRYNEAEQHWGLGQAHHALGDPPTARAHWDQAIGLLRDLGAIEAGEAAVLLREPVPPTPEIIRLNS